MDFENARETFFDYFYHIVDVAEDFFGQVFDALDSFAKGFNEA